MKFDGGNMYGYITGITETDDISFCPKCGELIKVFTKMERRNANVGTILEL